MTGRGEGRGDKEHVLFCLREVDNSSKCLIECATA